MSLTSLNTKFKLRRDTAANWEIADPVNSLELAIADGEPILAKVDGVYKMKIGDGIHHFAELPYYSGSDNGGAEKFVVTLTQDEQTEEWTVADGVTIADIVAADAANQVVVCRVPFADYNAYAEIPCWFAQEGFAAFGGLITFENALNVEAQIFVDSGNTEVGVRITPIVTPESGVSSWNDLTDKPFYDEVTPGINLEMPDGGNYVEASFTVTGTEPMTIPLKLYRAGGVYTPEQLVGATVTLDIGEADPESVVIEADSYLAIEQDGETVGYVAVGGGIHSFIVLADNTVFNTSLNIVGTTATLTSDNIPTAGTYLVNAVIGENETTCTNITKAASTIVHQIDSKYIPSSSGGSGTVSWNDLTDRPFYETVTAAGYNFEIDLDDPNYVSGYFNFGADVPAKFYRVGDPLTAVQLENAIGSVNNGEETETHVIESNYIEEITDNGDTVGLFVAGDMPYALVINNANTTINHTGATFGCSGTFTQAGTYLFWIDLSTLQEGATAYNPSLVKANEVGVVQLQDKFYKAPLIVEITGTTENNITTYSANATYSEILATLQAERPVYATVTNSNFDTIIIQAKALISGAINFSTMAYVGSSIYAIKIEINDQDEVSMNITTFGSAQGVNF